ncbi:hypothetical protein BJ170DRAFT_702446 [Xylariales sp. AK1849]|nr:hypothetical protein BJ170DRAFT_702446 [Xylariales sp. AK1849]
MKVEGRTFIISGGASGLGQACVETLTKAGGFVSILDMNEENGAELVSKLGPQTKFFVCNVLETESVKAAVDGTVEWIKTTQKPLGGVIPAAGVSTPATMLDRDGNALDLEDFDFVVNVNLRGTIDLVRQAVVHLAKVEPTQTDGERGVVVMVASSAAFDGQKGQVSYSASKGAVTAMTLPMTRDLARYGIRVVTIAPSLFESRMTSMMSDKVRGSLEKAMEFPRRAGQPDEFAGLVKHSIENAMLNGTVLRLDGGMRMPSKIGRLYVGENVVNIRITQVRNIPSNRKFRADSNQLQQPNFLVLIVFLKGQKPSLAICVFTVVPIATMAATKVAVLDDYQELSKPHFERLRDAGYEVTTFTDTLLPYDHPHTPQDVKDALVKRLEPFVIICTMRERTPITGGLVSKLPNLKLLLTTGGRNASIDVKACSERGIPVAGTTAGTTPEKSKPDSTTQHCVALILGLARNIAIDDKVMKSGGWQTLYNTGLSGKTFGTVGLGRLGSTVSRIMHLAFGMRIVAWSSNLTQEAADEKARSAGLPVDDGNGEKTFKAVSREDLFSTADVVSVQVVLSERSRGLINEDDLGKMKKSALFVNTSRGPIVNDQHLLKIAKSGSIKGIALDVYEIEPMPKDSEWRTTRWGEDGKSSVLLTPHMGYVEDETMAGWYQQQVDNVLRWEKGESLAVVFKTSGY